MNKGKKILAVILTVWGSIVTLIGMIFIFAWIDMAIGDGLQKSDMEAYFVLGAILLISSGLAGVLPLISGIKILRKNAKKRK